MTRYRRKVAYLAATAGALALSLAAGLAFSPEARHARGSRGVLLDRDPGEILSLEVSDSEGTLVFRRFGASWTLEEGGMPLPVRAERVEAYLETARSVRSLAEISRSESSWEALGLDDPSSRRVRLLLRDGSGAAEYRLGRYSPDGERVYLRKAGDSRAYAAPAPVSSRLPSGRKSWLDLRIFGEPVPLEDIQRLRISGSLSFSDGSGFRFPYSLDRSLSRGWESAEIQGLDPAAAARLVRAWMNAEAEEFSPDGPAPGSEGVLRVDLELGGGVLRSLWISGQPDAGGGYRAALTGTGRFLRLGAWTLRDLLKTPEELAYRSRP